MEIINRVHQIPLLAKLGTKRNPQILEIHDWRGTAVRDFQNWYGDS
jgi:hypothetical protein